MDQSKIGRFISECRKEKNFTQAQLAEKLGITDRAVSKWETGKSMPDISIMLDLCGTLGININELLTGERLTQDEYQRKAEENMLDILIGKNKSKTERIISGIIVAAFFIIAVSGKIISCVLTDDSVKAAIIAMSIVSLICFGGIWTAVTLLLKNKK